MSAKPVSLQGESTQIQINFKTAYSSKNALHPHCFPRSWKVWKRLCSCTVHEVPQPSFLPGVYLLSDFLKSRSNMKNGHSEVELFLRVTRVYKVAKASENVDCRKKIIIVFKVLTTTPTAFSKRCFHWLKMSCPCGLEVKTYRKNVLMKTLVWTWTKCCSIQKL